MLTPNATYIYESPDGGETVYAREPGAPLHTRKMIGQSYKAKSRIDQIQEDKLWGNIRRMAETDSGMADMLDQIKVYYHLKNTP
jgi:hypothetical protein